MNRCLKVESRMEIKGECWRIAGELLAIRERVDKEWQSEWKDGPR